MAIMLNIGPSNPNIWWVFFKYGDICLWYTWVHTHTLFNQRKVCSNQYISQKTVKNDKNRPNMLIQGPDGTLSNNSFLNIVISVYLMHECIHLHYLHKEKFAQIEILTQKWSKTVKNDENYPKCSFRASVGPYTHISWSWNYLHHSPHRKWVW